MIRFKARLDHIVRTIPTAGSNARTFSHLIIAAGAKRGKRSTVDSWTNPNQEALPSLRELLAIARVIDDHEKEIRIDWLIGRFPPESDIEKDIEKSITRSLGR